MKFIHMYAGKICHTDQEWLILNVKPILFYLHRMVDFWCFFCKMITSWYTVERSYENYDWIMAIEFVIARSSAKRESHQIQYIFFLILPAMSVTLFFWDYWSEVHYIRREKCTRFVSRNGLHYVSGFQAELGWNREEETINFFHSTDMANRSFE